MRSEGFPFIVWGSGAWTLVRRQCLIGSLIPSLWGKLQNLSFSKVSKQVVMSFCVAGVALCDIPTCFIRCRECQRMSKWAEVSHDMLVLLRPSVSSRVSGFPVASPCLWGKLQNLSFSKVSKQVVMSFCVAGVALCDIPTCFIRCRECQRMSKWAEVSHDMLVLLRPRVSSRVSGFPVASPCLWGKLQNLSFSKVSKQVVMSFCVAGVALCDIPTCLITCREFQNWRKSRTTCSFCCAHVSRLESLVFLWHRRVYIWGKLQNLSFSKVSKQVVMSFCMAAVPLCDIPTCLITCRECQNWRKSRTTCSFCCAHVSRLESLVFLWHRRVYSSDFRRFPSRLSCRFAWQALHFVTFQPVWYQDAAHEPECSHVC